MADEYNSAQAHLGLIGSGGGSLAPFGMPTPPPIVQPQVMHPGEFARNIVQQTQTMAQFTTQSAIPTQPPPSAINSYAGAYRQNMGNINNQMFNPYVAQSMASMTGMDSFAPGMMPSPIHMTPPAMGIFRQYPQGPAPSIPQTPAMPLIPTPFTPSFPPAQFQTPSDYSYQRAEQRGFQFQGAAMAAPGALAHMGTDWALSRAGEGLGANLGARLGGVRGAGIGSALGAMGGFALSEMGGFGQAAQGMVNQLNPFATTWNRAAQMRGMSQEFVVGGADLASTGRGLSAGGSMNLARQMEDMGYSSRFRKETGGQFSNNDLTRITKVSADQGLLDMYQTPEEIVGRVRNIAKTLRTFMRVANEPDIREALKQMGQMNAMGLSLPETMNVMSNARMFAKMAGTNIKGIMESGLSGAMTFQQNGLSAGLGMNMGMGAMGMARQAVAAGAYSPQQLAMLGGIQGIAQREMQGQAATLKLPMLAASMAQFGGAGGIGVNAGNVSAMQGGQFGIGQMAGMAARNFAGRRPEELGMFLAQQSEIQDTIGKQLGPIGMKTMDMRMVMNTMRDLGMRGQAGAFTAAQAMGKSGDEAKQLAGQMASPGFFRGMISQVRAGAHEMGSEEARRAEEEAPGFFEKGLPGRVARLGKGVGSGMRDIGAGIGTGIANAAQSWSAMGRGEYITRTPESLRIRTDDEARAVGKLTAADLDNAGTISRRAITSEQGVSLSGRINLAASRGYTGGLGTLAALNTYLPGSGETGATQARAAEDMDRGSRLVLSGQTASKDERSGALKRYAKRHGISEDEAAKAMENATVSLASAAKSKASTFGRGAGFTGSELDKAAGGTADDTRDVMQYSGERLKVLATREGSDALTNTRAKGTENEEISSVKTGEAMQEEMRGRLFHTGGYSMSLQSLFGSSDPKKEKTMQDLIFSKGGDVAALALLTGDAYSNYLKGIPKDKQAATISAANKLRQTAEDMDHDTFVKLERSFSAMPQAQQKGEAALVAKQLTSAKGKVARDAGINKLFAGDEKTRTLARTKGGGIERALDAAIAEGKTAEQLGLSGRNADQYRELGKDDTSKERRAAIIEAFNQTAVATGSSASGAAGGGAMTAAGLAGEKQAQDLGNMSAEAATTFKDAVTVFAQAVNPEGTKKTLGINLGGFSASWR